MYGLGGSSYATIDRIGQGSSTLSGRYGKSYKVANPSTEPPWFLTSSMIAFAVPHVAATSSIISTLAPSKMLSVWMAMGLRSYSLIEPVPICSRGSFSGSRAGMKGFFCANAIGWASNHPRAPGEMMISYSSGQKRFLTALTACSLVLGFSKTVVMSIGLCLATKTAKVFISEISRQ